jgi:hypothetical protein
MRQTFLQLKVIGGRPRNETNDSRMNKRYNLRPRASLRKPERLGNSGLSTPEPRKRSPQVHKTRSLVKVTRSQKTDTDHATKYPKRYKRRMKLVVEVPGTFPQSIYFHAELVNRKSIVKQNKPKTSPADAWMYQPWILDWARNQLGQEDVSPGV